MIVIRVIPTTDSTIHVLRLQQTPNSTVTYQLTLKTLYVFRPSLMGLPSTLTWISTIYMHSIVLGFESASQDHSGLELTNIYALLATGDVYASMGSLARICRVVWP